MELGRGQAVPSEGGAASRLAGTSNTQAAQYRLDPFHISDGVEPLVHSDRLVQQWHGVTGLADAPEGDTGVLTSRCQRVGPGPIAVDRDGFEQGIGIVLEQTSAAQRDPAGGRRPARGALCSSSSVTATARWRSPAATAIRTRSGPIARDAIWR